MKAVKIKNLKFRLFSDAKPNRKLEIGNWKLKPAFTLVELMVVITLIVLISAIALPSVIKLFSTGTDTQATNMLAAQLSYARAIAIQNNTYAGVHVQMADAKNSAGTALLNPDLEETCFSAIVMYNQSNGYFELTQGTKPRRIPGSIAFGQLTGTFVNNSGNYQNLTDTNLPVFTTFTIVFSPSGQVVTNVNGGNVLFHDTATGLFNNADPAIWDLANAGGAAGEPAATAVTMFDYTELAGRDAADRDNYLNEAGQFLPINVYTGQLFPRK